jgi:hypothetical protein
MKGVIGLKEMLAIALFVPALVVIFDLIAPYVGLRGPGVMERIIYKIKELMMMPIEDIVLMYHFEGGEGGWPIPDSSWHGYDAEKLTGSKVELSIREAMIGNGSIYFPSLDEYIKVNTVIKKGDKSINYFAELIKGGITLDFWIKAEEVGGENYKIIDTDNFNVAILAYGGIETGVKLEGIADWLFCTSGGAKINLNSWTHVVITYTNTTGECKTFINGRITNTEVISPEKKPLKKHEGGDLIIGRFKGYMDELRIYTRALDSTEIVAHFQGIY